MVEHRGEPGRGQDRQVGGDAHQARHLAVLGAGELIGQRRREGGEGHVRGGLCEEPAHGHEPGAAPPSRARSPDIAHP